MIMFRLVISSRNFASWTVSAGLHSRVLGFPVVPGAVEVNEIAFLEVARPIGQRLILCHDSSYSTMR
jgi:hypothetical protein